MTKESQRTAAEAGSEPMRATRRTILYGTGVAGLLTLGVSSASAEEAETDARLRAEEAEADARLRAEEAEAGVRQLLADHIPLA